MRILLLTNEFPLPVNAGGVRRQLGLTEALAARHEVHYLARERTTTPPTLIADLHARIGGPVETFPEMDRAHATTPLARGRRWARAIRRRGPAWTESTTSAPLAARAAELAPGFDVAITLDDTAHAYVETLGTLVPVVLDKHNVLAWSRRPAPGLPPHRRAAAWLPWWLVHQWEGRTTAAAAGVAVTSEDEATRFADLYGWRPAVIPSAIPAPPLVADPQTAPRAVVWLGDHTYAPNRDGLLRFVREGWAPLGETGTRLLVAGRGAPPEVEALAEQPGVEILGFVDDLDALLAGARAAVAPVWAGAGIKMKTLSLMGAGLPLVGTSVAFEGLAVTDGVDARVAETPERLASALRDVLDDTVRATDIGRAGHDLILRDATWDGLIGRYETLLSEVARA